MRHREPQRTALTNKRFARFGCAVCNHKENWCEAHSARAVTQLMIVNNIRAYRIWFICALRHSCHHHHCKSIWSSRLWLMLQIILRNMRAECDMQFNGFSDIATSTHCVVNRKMNELPSVRVIFKQKPQPNTINWRGKERKGKQSKEKETKQCHWNKNTCTFWVEWFYFIFGEPP